MNLDRTHHGDSESSDSLRNATIEPEELLNTKIKLANKAPFTTKSEDGFMDLPGADSMAKFKLGNLQKNGSPRSAH